MAIHSSLSSCIKSMSSWPVIRQCNHQFRFLPAEALRGMEAVAEHINEMQKIYEEYGAIFEELIKAHRDGHPHGKVRRHHIYTYDMAYQKSCILCRDVSQEKI